jgi:hypothetical protein
MAHIMDPHDVGTELPRLRGLGLAGGWAHPASALRAPADVVEGIGSEDRPAIADVEGAMVRSPADDRGPQPGMRDLHGACVQRPGRGGKPGILDAVEGGRPIGDVPVGAEGAVNCA